MSKRTLNYFKLIIQTLKFAHRKTLRIWGM